MEEFNLDMVRCQLGTLVGVEANVLATEITEGWPVSVALLEVQEIIIDVIPDNPSLASLHESHHNDYLLHAAVHWKRLH